MYFFGHVWSGCIFLGPVVFETQKNTTFFYLLCSVRQKRWKRPDIAEVGKLARVWFSRFWRGQKSGNDRSAIFIYKFNFFDLGTFSSFLVLVLLYVVIKKYNPKNAPKNTSNSSIWNSHETDSRLLIIKLLYCHYPTLHINIHIQHTNKYPYPEKMTTMTTMKTMKTCWGQKSF